MNTSRICKTWNLCNYLLDGTRLFYAEKYRTVHYLAHICFSFEHPSWVYDFFSKTFYEQLAVRLEFHFKRGFKCSFRGGMA